MSEIKTIYDIVDVLLEHEKRLDALEDVVSWKDFRDFLDDNAEDFESISKRLDALTKQVSELAIAVGRLEGRLMGDDEE